jgi:hypothetical protein
MVLTFLVFLGTPFREFYLKINILAIQYQSFLKSSKKVAHNFQYQFIMTVFVCGTL